MNPQTTILAVLGAAPFALVALAFGWPLIRRAVDDACARHRECEAERYSAIDRETARAIGLGGTATHFEHAATSSRERNNG